MIIFSPRQFFENPDTEYRIAPTGNRNHGYEVGISEYIVGTDTCVGGSFAVDCRLPGEFNSAVEKEVIAGIEKIYAQIGADMPMGKGQPIWPFEGFLAGRDQWDIN